ncbi:hypothetical protein KO505_01660 [Psychrosphaera sp. F3M07]|uniref:hypothetical protein n=1 Tax=Psychrosphaera sp. F3M07 TaxID=2841560 RepID=UPI001C08D108|nr:hypothetical protein [Psychrosphaera sp. F3M07]MBU2916665.1 hypothetical protein [Psychrosphaera sp. F3M07]
MVKSKMKLALSLALGLVLSGCGGSSFDDENVSAASSEKILTVTGKAIDGYIVGGTVFLDINGNGNAEPNEPQKETEVGGDYTLNISEEDAECLAYSAIIVDVPVGAWDEGSEDENVAAHEVTDPYQIVLQPTFKAITEEDFTNGLVRNISPLTTVVWEAIERSYPPFAENKGNNPNDSETNAKHCHYLKKHDEAVQELKQEIEDAVVGLVQFYNLSADQMYADFIADKDSDAFHVAQDIMKGLKAAYKRKTDLREQYSDYQNAEIRVFVHRNPELDEYFQVDNGWYRDEIVFLGTEDLVEFSKLQDTDKLDEVDFISSKFHELGQEWNEQDKSGWLSVRKDAYREMNGTYRCAKNERVSFDVNGIHYELGNSSDSATLANSFEECNFDDFSSPYEKNYHLRYTEGEASYSAAFYFRAEQARFTELADWKEFTDNPEFNAQDMIDTLILTPYKWEDEVTIDTAYWRKRKEEPGVQIDIDNDNNWQRATKQDDGTTLYECSSDGENWTECTD